MTSFHTNDFRVEGMKVKKSTVFADWLLRDVKVVSCDCFFSV